MIKPLVSVVVPVYNSGKTIHKCLNSILAQSFENIEIILVNDCSKDDSENIIIGYTNKDRRVKLITHEVNKRAGGARNTGIMSAKGIYVCFVDSDDWLSPNAIELMLRESNDCNVDIIVPQWCNFISETQQIKMSNLLLDASKDDNLHHMLMHGVRSLGCLIKKQIIIDNNLFFPENIIWEDNPIVPTWFYLAKDIVVIDSIAYYYNNMPNSLSKSRSIKSQYDRIVTCDMLIENLQRIDVYTRDKVYIDYRFLYLTVFTIKMFASMPYKEVKVYLDYLKCQINKVLPNPLFYKFTIVNRLILKNPHISVLVGSVLRRLYRFIK